MKKVGDEEERNSYLDATKSGLTPINSQREEKARERGRGREGRGGGEEEIEAMIKGYFCENTWRWRRDGKRTPARRHWWRFTRVLMNFLLEKSINTLWISHNCKRLRSTCLLTPFTRTSTRVHVFSTIPVFVVIVAHCNVSLTSSSM